MTNDIVAKNEVVTVEEEAKAHKEINRDMDTYGASIALKLHLSKILANLPKSHF